MKKKREKEEKQKKHKKAKRSEDDDINNDTLDFDFFMNGIKAWAGQTPRKQFINSTYKLTDEDLIYLMEALSMKSHAIAKQDALDFVADRTEHDGTEGSDFIMCLINSSERVLEDGGVVGDSDMVGGYHWIIAFLKRVKKKISMKLFDVLSSTRLGDQVIKATKVPTKEEVEALDAKRDTKERGYPYHSTSRHLRSDWQFVSKGCEALNWQSDDWACGYLGLYAILKAEDLPNKQEFLDSNGKDLEKMPEGLYKDVTCNHILKLSQHINMFITQVSRHWYRRS